MHCDVFLIMPDSRDGGYLWRRGVFRQEVLELLKQIRMASEQFRDLLINILDGLVMHAVHVEDREE